VELLGQLHHAQGLAVALRVGAAEVDLDLLAGVAALVMSYKHDALPGKAGKPADYGLVVRIEPIAVQLAEIAAEHPDVVAQQRPPRVPGDQHVLPRRQIAVGLLEGLPELGPDAVDDVRVVATGLHLRRFKPRNFLLHLDDGFLKLQQVCRVARPVLGQNRPSAHLAFLATKPGRLPVPPLDRRAKANTVRPRRPLASPLQRPAGRIVDESPSPAKLPEWVKHLPTDS